MNGLKNFRNYGIIALDFWIIFKIYSVMNYSLIKLHFVVTYHMHLFIQYMITCDSFDFFLHQLSDKEIFSRSFMEQISSRFSKLFSDYQKFSLKRAIRHPIYLDLTRFSALLYFFLLFNLTFMNISTAYKIFIFTL